MEQRKRGKRSLTVRLAETGYGRIADRADRADVDVSRMVRRMLAYADRHMPDEWVPSRSIETSGRTPTPERG